MSVKDHWRNDKNFFIQDGLSGRDYIMPGNLWRTNTLKTIQRIFNDDEVGPARILCAVGRAYHPGCFVCQRCNGPLEGSMFGVDDEDRILCREDYSNMSVKDHWRNDKNVFIQDGLSGRDYIMPGNLWRTNTLKTIQRIFNDDERTIDYLKFDIEFSEWGVLNTSIGSLERVKQIAFEVHMQAAISASRLRFYLGLLRGLRQLGFYRWYAHRNPIGRWSKS